MPQPTAIVVSSPGREQYWWRLSRPVAPEEGEDLNRRLAYAMAADLSGWDLTQLLRVPGTRNRKYPDAPLVELAHLSEDSYDPAELAAYLPKVQATRESEAARSARPEGVVGIVDLSRLSERTRELVLFGDREGRYASRSEADFAACLGMFNGTRSLSGVLSAARRRRQRRRVVVGGAGRLHPRQPDRREESAADDRRDARRATRRAVPAAPIGRAATDEFVNDFVTDVMPYIEKHYRVLTDRANTAIAGLSMGGGHTLQVAIPRLERFAYIGVYSSGLLGAFPELPVPADAAPPAAAPATGPPATPPPTAAEWEKLLRGQAGRRGAEEGAEAVLVRDRQGGSSCIDDDAGDGRTVQEARILAGLQGDRRAGTPGSTGGTTCAEFAPQLFQNGPGCDDAVGCADGAINSQLPTSKRGRASPQGVMKPRSRRGRQGCAGAGRPRPLEQGAHRAAGKRATRFLAASSVTVIRVDPTLPPAHRCAWRVSPTRIRTRRGHRA